MGRSCGKGTHQRRPWCLVRGRGLQGLTNARLGPVVCLVAPPLCKLPCRPQALHLVKSFERQLLFVVYTGGHVQYKQVRSKCFITTV